MAKTDSRQKQDQASAPSHERHFYAVDKAFGRFGIRLFSPTTMPSPHWHGHIEANYLTGASMIYDFDGERVVVPPGQLVIFWAGVPHQLTELIPDGTGKPKLANIYIPVDSFLFMTHISEMQVALLGGALVFLPCELCDFSDIERWYRDYRSNDFERLEIMRIELNAKLRRALTAENEWIRQPDSHRPDQRALSSTNVGHVVEMVRFI
ncbi:MAG: hypothetical protein P8X43_09295, partial [Maritimibacter sp.]